MTDISIYVIELGSYLGAHSPMVVVTATSITEAVKFANKALDDDAIWQDKTAMFIKIDTTYEEPVLGMYFSSGDYTGEDLEFTSYSTDHIGVIKFHDGDC